MSNVSKPIPQESDLRKEALVALIYFAVYLGYLFLIQENEIVHWLTMVIFPFGLIYLLQKRKSSTRSIRHTLSTFGLKKSSLTNGLLWAILIGLVLSFLQLFLSRDSDRILLLLKSGKFIYQFPIALVIMFFTAGFTEEFFFRGFLQTRLQQLFSSKIFAVIITSIIFGVYHLPYAYLNSNWPSYGNFYDAITLAFSQGIPMGIILGILYIRFKNNLLACVVVHALLNSLPAMLALKFG